MGRASRKRALSRSALDNQQSGGGQVAERPVVSGVVSGWGQAAPSSRPRERPAVPDPSRSPQAAQLSTAPRLSGPSPLVRLAIDSETWLGFRHLALQAGMPASQLLGELVRREVETAAGAALAAET